MPAGKGGCLQLGLYGVAPPPRPPRLRRERLLPMRDPALSAPCRPLPGLAARQRRSLALTPRGCRCPRAAAPGSSSARQPPLPKSSNHPELADPPPHQFKRHVWPHRRGLYFVPARAPLLRSLPGHEHSMNSAVQAAPLWPYPTPVERPSATNARQLLHLSQQLLELSSLPVCGWPVLPPPARARGVVRGHPSTLRMHQEGYVVPYCAWYMPREEHGSRLQHVLRKGGQQLA